MRTLGSQVLLIALLACGVSQPSQLPHPAADALTRSAAGCWQFRAQRGSTPYLPTPVLAQLDTVPAFPGGDDLLFRVAVDSGSNPGPRIRIAHWAPLKQRGGIYVFWGDGFTGLDMRLLAHGDTMSGPSAQTTDVGVARNGPTVLAVRVACL